MKIVTLLTDFGTTDGYAGAIKGVIKSLSPNIEIIDISHTIPAFSVPQAAYAVLSYYNRFPKGTVHLCVVDPGVGSERDGLIMQWERGFLVGPDNGIFDLIVQAEPLRCFKMNTQRDISATFHGRDVFAPVAAQLADGEQPAMFGSEIKYSPNNLLAFHKKRDKISVAILTVDHFGNVIFAIQKKDIPARQISIIEFNDYRFHEIKNYYSEVETGRFLCLWNSLGFLEIACNQGRAVEQLNIKMEDKLIIYLD